MSRGCDDVLPRVVWYLEAPDAGGAERYVISLAAGLRVDPWLVATAPLPVRLQAMLAEAGLGGRLVVLPPVKGKADVLGLLRTIRALRRLRPDLVHVNANAPGNARFGLAAALTLVAVPVVLTVHTRVQITSRLQRLVLRHLHRRCQAVITVSSPIADQMAGLGARPDRLSVVRNGVAVPPAARRDRGDGVLHVGAVGRLTRQKGFDILIAAVRRLQGEGVDLRLLLAGEGEEWDSLERSSEGLPVRMLGHVDSTWVWDQVDVVCLPSRHEGLPFVLLEAMAAGLPVVATDVGDIRDAAGDTVLLVPAGDPVALAHALRRLLDPETRDGLGRAARQHVERHLSLDSMLAHTTRIYAAAGQPVALRSPGESRGACPVIDA